MLAAIKVKAQELKLLEDEIISPLYTNNTTQYIQVGDEVWMLNEQRTAYRVSVESIVGNLVTVRCDQGFYHICEIHGMIRREKRYILVTSLTSSKSQREQGFKE